MTVLGDDLYCRQPFCELLLSQGFNFILTCLASSHLTLYEHLEGIDLPTVIKKRWTGKEQQTYTYRYLNGLPLKDGEDALLVNWCELTVTRPDGTVIYHNGFATCFTITNDKGAALIERR
ncbi:MAG: hypothetical protein F6J98_42485 [Moorea sp. SIO4G2]|nr:hypothetical protein [Moorena sp. SIO4G2]